MSKYNKTPTPPSSGEKGPFCIADAKHLFDHYDVFLIHRNDRPPGVIQKNLSRRFHAAELLESHHLLPEIMKDVHLTPEEAVQAFIDLNARSLLAFTGALSI